MDHKRLRKYCRLVSLTAVVLAFTTMGSHAALRITGDARSVLVKAQDTPLKDVLAELRKSYKFKYQSAVTLDRTVSGTYTGSLQHVLSRLLTGYDYAIRSSSTGTLIMIFDSAKLTRDVSVRYASRGNATWRDGDGHLIAAPRPSSSEFAGPHAPKTWRDGDGNLIAAPPSGAEQFAGSSTAATWRDGDGNLIAPPSDR
jgi:hypothetical protein